MPRHACDRAIHPIDGPYISNRAEQTSDDIVSRAQIEISHVSANIFTAGILDSGRPQIFFVQIDTIDRVFLLQKFSVLSSPASNIKNRPSPRHRSADYFAQNLAFTPVILEMINRVVKLRTLKEHQTTLPISSAEF